MVGCFFNQLDPRSLKNQWINTQNSTFYNLQFTLIDVCIGIPVMSRDLVMSQKAWEYWMHCMLSYECFLYHQPVIQWVRTWKMQFMYDNLIDISFWTPLLKACTLVYFTRRRRRRLRKRHLKCEFALPQLYRSYSTSFSSCLELKSKGLHQSSGKEKESRCLLFPVLDKTWN